MQTWQQLQHQQDSPISIFAAVNVSKARGTNRTTRALSKCLQSLCSRPTQELMSPFVSQEALAYFNMTTKQKEMLEFALNYLQTDDEV